MIPTDILSGTKQLSIQFLLFPKILGKVIFWEDLVGKSFLAVLLEANVDGASIVSEKLRKVIEETPLVFKNKRIKFTVSIGLTEFSIGSNIDTLIERADFALYKAKNNGKNKVEIN